MENSTIAIVGVAGYLAFKSGLLGTKKTRRKKTKRAVSVTTKNIRQVLRNVRSTKVSRPLRKKKVATFKTRSVPVSSVRSGYYEGYVPWNKENNVGAKYAFELAPKKFRTHSGLNWKG